MANLAPAKFAPTKVGNVTQDEHQRVQRIKEYVLARLREELATAPRGAQAQLAKKLGVSGAHLSNMLSPNPTRQPGEDFRRKVSAHWGISYAQLEAAAFGEDGPPSTAQPILKAEELAPNLATVLEQYAWMPELPAILRAVVREQAQQHYRFGGEDVPAAEWQRIVTGLEREALALLARRAGHEPPHEPTAPQRSPSGFSMKPAKRRARS
jgi:transcriptional regulator with XRE-family HTH domain